MTFPNTAAGQVIETRSIVELQNILKDADADTLVLLDVDDTLITPKANMFRYKNNPHHGFIDEIKNNKNTVLNFEDILSQWRAQRKTMLITPEWPAIIEDLQAKGAKVFALTQMDTGAFGVIQSMEEWRYQELLSLGFLFQDTLQDKTKIILKEDARGYCLFYHGILMTGPFTKVEVLDAFLKYLSPKKIIFVDDREKHVMSLAHYLDERHIAFTGIILRAVEELSGTPNEAIIKVQKQSLLEKALWLEDEEAIKKGSDANLP